MDNLMKAMNTILGNNFVQDKFTAMEFGLVFDLMVLMIGLVLTVVFFNKMYRRARELNGALSEQEDKKSKRLSAAIVISFMVMTLSVYQLMVDIPTLVTQKVCPEEITVRMIDSLKKTQDKETQLALAYSTELETALSSVQEDESFPTRLKKANTYSSVATGALVVLVMVMQIITLVKARKWHKIYNQQGEYVEDTATGMIRIAYMEFALVVFIFSFVLMLMAQSGPCGADVSSLLYYHPNGLVKESLASLSNLIG